MNFVVFLSFMVVLFPVAAIAVLLVGYKRSFKKVGTDDDAPILTTKASVVSKDFSKRNRKYTEYFAVFLIPNQGEKELFVSEKNYQDINEKDEGELIYQGDWLLDFKRKNYDEGA